MLTMAAGSVRLHVRVDGPDSGPAVVFANSLGTDLRIWDRLLPLLPGGLRTIRYDKRGHGLSDCPAGDWGMDDHVDDLRTLLHELDVGPMVVVGLSVGGMIAMRLAQRGSGLLRGLVLMDTAVKIGSPEMWAERMGRIEAGGIVAVAPDILERWFTPGFRDTDPAYAACRNMLCRTPRHGYLQTCAAIRDSDLTAAAAGFGGPVLALAGSEDGSTPPELVRATAAQFSGGRFVEIADAGHLPCLEQPQVTADLLADFLREVGHV